MLGRASLALLLLGCSPDQPEETRGCSSLSECTLGQVCDVELGECIDEPDDRFIGSFRCVVGDGEAGRAELVGRIRNDRWSLTFSLCSMDPDDNEMLLAFYSPFGEDALYVFLDLGELSDQNALIGPAIVDVDDPRDYASLVNGGTALAYGYSNEGKLELSRAPAAGRELTGYLDFSMYEAASKEEFFGVPCPRGLADCGDITGEAGGPHYCRNLSAGLVCTRECTTDGDCSRGSYVNDDVRIEPVCVQGFCTKECMRQDDCASPLECIQSAPGEPAGCF